MMTFSAKPRRTPPESIVPMINVVFLLLIFFLMTAQIAPPEPFEVSPPTAAPGDPAEGELTLYLGPDGTVAFRDVIGQEKALAALGQARDIFCKGDPGCATPTLKLRADGGADGQILAGLLKQLGDIGFSTIELITAKK